MKHAAPWPSWVLLAGTAAAVVFFGGTEPLSLGLAQAAIFLASAAVLVRGREAIPAFPLHLLAVPALLVSVVALQLAPLPATWLGGDRVLEAGARFAPISIDSAETGMRMVHLLACACAFALALLAARRGPGLRVVLYGLAGIGLFEAGYGLLQYLTGWQQIFTYVKVHNLHEATGTYINRNHYAGLLGMTLPFCLGLAWYHLSGSRRGNSLRRAALDPQTFRAWLWFFLAGVLFVALIFSRSRMGILAVSVSSLVVFGLIVAGRNKSVAVVLCLALLMLGIGLAAWIGPGPVIDRFERLGDEIAGPQTRPAIWQDGLHLVSAHPLLGTGLGTFPIAYTSVQTAFLGLFVNSAHNDYLEFASDLGVPAALIFFAACAWVLWTAMQRALADRDDRLASASSLGVAGALLAILLHSAVDFNLQIPGNALVFSVVLGLGCAAAPRGQDSSNRGLRANEGEEMIPV